MESPGEDGKDDSEDPTSILRVLGDFKSRMSSRAVPGSTAQRMGMRTALTSGGVPQVH